jgi:hypothetical protein
LSPGARPALQRRGMLLLIYFDIPARKVQAISKEFLEARCARRPLFTGRR